MLNKESEIDDIIAFALKAKHTKFPAIVNEAQLAVAKGEFLRLLEISEYFRRLAKKLFKAYLKLNIDEKGKNISKLLLYKKAEFCKEFYLQEAVILNNLIWAYSSNGY